MSPKLKSLLAEAKLEDPSIKGWSRRTFTRKRLSPERKMEIAIQSTAGFIPVMIDRIRSMPTCAEAKKAIGTLVVASHAFVPIYNMLDNLPDDASPSVISKDSF